MIHPRMWVAFVFVGHTVQYFSDAVSVAPNVSLMQTDSEDNRILFVSSSGEWM